MHRQVLDAEHAAVPSGHDPLVTLTFIGLRLTDLDFRLFLVDEYSLECLRASMAVFKLFTKAQLWMALFGKCLNWFKMICPWTTMNLSTLGSCIMTAVVSTAKQLTIQLQHLES